MFQLNETSDTPVSWASGTLGGDIGLTGRQANVPRGECGCLRVLRQTAIDNVVARTRLIMQVGRLPAA